MKRDFGDTVAVAVSKDRLTLQFQPCAVGGGVGSICVPACVCARVRLCPRARVCVCVPARVCVCEWVCCGGWGGGRLASRKPPFQSQSSPTPPPPDHPGCFFSGRGANPGVSEVAAIHCPPSRPHCRSLRRPVPERRSVAHSGPSFAHLFGQNNAFTDIFLFNSSPPRPSIISHQAQPVCWFESLGIGGSALRRLPRARLGPCWPARVAPKECRGGV